MRIILALAVLLAASAGAWAQCVPAGYLGCQVVTAPVAQTPAAHADAYMVVEKGVVNQVPGDVLQAAIANLSASPAAISPLGGTDSLVVTQGGLNKLFPVTGALSLGGLSLTGSLSIVSGGSSSVTLSVAGGLNITGNGGITLPGFSVDRLGNTTGLTYTLTPSLKPPIPKGGNFIFYVDAFDKSLYVRGWLGTVTRIAGP